MPKARKNEFYVDKKQFTIFVFIDFLNNECFVWKTKNPELKKVFEAHYQLRIARTKEMFQRGKEVGITPQMFLLENIEDTEAVAFKHCIAWTKYFMKRGYQSTNYEVHKSYTEHLDEVTQEIYDRIRDRLLSEVCTEENQLFADYGTHRKPKDKTKTSTKITITLSPEEYEKIFLAAENLAITPAAYVKTMTLKGEIKRENFEFFLEYKDKLALIERRLRGILKTIYDTKKYYPADLQNIQNLCDQVGEVHLDAMKIFNKRKYNKRTRRKEKPKA